MWNKTNKSTSQEIRTTLDNIYALYLEVYKNFKIINEENLSRDSIQRLIKSRDSQGILSQYNLVKNTNDDILAACNLILNAKLLGKLEDEDSKRIKKLSDDLNDKFTKLKDILAYLKKAIDEVKIYKEEEKVFTRKTQSINSCNTSHTLNSNKDHIEMTDFNNIENDEYPYK